MTARLATVFARGTAVATAITAVGAALEWTPWQPAAGPVVLTGAAAFAALPVVSLVLQAAGHRRRRDRLYLALTTVVLAVVLANAVTATVLG